MGLILTKLAVAGCCIMGGHTNSDRLDISLLSNPECTVYNPMACAIGDL